MSEGLPASEIKISSSPTNQERVEQVTNNLTSQLEPSNPPPQAINSLARSAVAKEIWINRLRQRFSKATNRAEIAEAQTMYDGKTGLHNETWFKERFARAINQQQRTGKPFFVLMMDVDDFKPINTRFTHPGGDNVLNLMHKIGTRPDEQIARYAGDEFTQILSDDINLEQAIVVANRNAKQFKDASEEIIPHIPVIDPNTPPIASASISLGLIEHSPGMDYKQMMTAVSATMLEGKKFEKGIVTVRNNDGTYLHFDKEGKVVELKQVAQVTA